MNRFLRLITAAATCALAMLVASAAPAFAHNSLLSSNPTDGAALTATPAQLVMDFQNDVPLDTLTVTHVDPTGARTELTGTTHGASEKQTITPVPALVDGEHSLRWRLVGPDGHPITGRITFTLATTVTSAVPTTSATSQPPVSVAPAASNPPSSTAGDEFSTPRPIRWLLRYASYAAIMVVVGFVVASVAMWPQLLGNPRSRRMLDNAFVGIVVLAFAQLLVVASDVGGAAPWAALGDVDAAAHTWAGAALLLRMIVGAVAWLVVRSMSIGDAEIRHLAYAVVGIVLLGTWAYAGHARSLRWPALGVATDIVHHGAAAIWIGGLIVVLVLTSTTRHATHATTAVGKFSALAPACVIALAATGVVQTVRVTQPFGDVMSRTHGKLLVAKVVLLGAMLLIARNNRNRVNDAVAARLAHGSDEAAGSIRALRSGVVAETIIGGAVVALTAAMVVSPPIG